MSLDKLSPPPRDPSLLRLAAPLILSFWLRSLFTFVDTLYASYLGDAAIAAIGAAIPLDFLLIATWVGLSSSLTSYLARAVGAHDTQQFDLLVARAKKMIRVVVALFCLIGIGVYFFAGFLDLESEVREGFAIYGSVFLVGSAFTSFWSVIPDSIVKAHHDTRSTMMAGIISNLINVALNTIFVFVFDWGLFGIAFSTVLGRIGGLVYALDRARKLESARRQALSSESNELGDEKTPLPDLAHPVRAILKLGVPSGLAYLLVTAELSVVNTLFTTIPDSTAAIGAFGVFYRVLMFFGMPILAITVAQLPFVARYVMRNKLELIQRSYRQAILTGFVYSALVVAPLCLLFADDIMGFLSRSQALKDYGRFGIHCVPLFCLVMVPYNLSRPIFEGFQKGKPTVVMAVIRNVVLAAPLAYAGLVWGERHWKSGFEGLILGLWIAALLSAVIYFVWARRFLRQILNEAAPGRSG